jgi:hypothetical protein
LFGLWPLGRDKRETTWSFITTVWFVGSVHLGRRDYCYAFGVRFGHKIWAPISPNVVIHLREFGLDFGLNFTLCVHMDGWMDGHVPQICPNTS